MIEKKVKNCMSCKNKNCYIATLPEDKKKDCEEHHENYDWNIVFDCRNYNKYKKQET